MVNEKLASISGEEDIMAMTFTEALCIKANAKIEVCSFRSIEIGNIICVAKRFIIPKPILLKSNRIGPKLIIGEKA